ncbi:MAG: hypothetical protein JRN68_11100 [Nitrososphaerota archaeon]|nr:hypothetical protein [Nitrososphaerota archaeon]
MKIGTRTRHSKMQKSSLVLTSVIPTWLLIKRGEEASSISTKLTPSLMSGVRKKIKRNSLIGGIAMAALAIFFAFLSYFTKSFVFEADSVVSFIAALLLFTTEQSDTVQKRVVGKVIGSFDTILSELAPPSLSDGNVIFVPMSSSVESVVTLLEPPGSNDGSDIVTPLTFTPLGRGLAELILREMGQTNPSVDSLLESLPHLVTGELALATGIQIRSTSVDEYEFILDHPVMINGISGNKTKPVTSVIGSLFGVLLAYSSQRNVSIVDYNTNPAEGTERIVMKIEEQKDHSKINGIQHE